MNRTFSKTEKLNWVLKYLVRILEPTIINSYTFQCKTKWNGKEKDQVLCYLRNDYSMGNLPENIPFPFDGVSVLITKKFITIIGDDFEYQFPTCLLMVIYSRFLVLIEEL